jgi:hypothetical protein
MASPLRSVCRHCVHVPLQDIFHRCCGQSSVYAIIWGCDSFNSCGRLNAAVSLVGVCMCEGREEDGGEKKGRWLAWYQLDLAVPAGVAK